MLDNILEVEEMTWDNLQKDVDNSIVRAGEQLKLFQGKWKQKVIYT